MKNNKVITGELFTALDDATGELVTLVEPVDENEFNVIPFKDSWTVAQLAVHVTKSNKAIVQGLGMPGMPPNRDPEEKAPHLKKMFLDFSAKYQSPAFIVPEMHIYDKNEVVHELKHSIEQLNLLRFKTNLEEIIELPVFGEITKLELLHFVSYHTQRHIHQLKKILAAISNSSRHGLAMVK